jgi:formylglycine-generating enzyme required for sulfatase activity
MWTCYGRWILSILPFLILSPFLQASSLVCSKAHRSTFHVPSPIERTLRELAALRLNLDQAQVTGSPSPVLTAIKDDYLRKENLLLEYMDQHQIMTREELRKWIIQEVVRLQAEQQTHKPEDNSKKEEESRRRREQEEQIKVSVIDGTRAIFHKVRPGSFMMGETGKEVAVTLTQMPEVMATHMSQIIYKTIAELANQRFPGKYQINSDPSRYKGDTRPVEWVSYDDAEVWTKALNDLSEAGEPALQDLIPGHQKGMHYEAFMTEAQREYLMKMARTEDGDSIDEMLQRNDFAKLEQYAVFDRRDSEGSVLVDEKKPLFIDGKPFHGLSGNVWEWVKDAWAPWEDGSTALLGGTDPVSISGSYRVIRGGCWNYGAQYLRSDNRYGYSPGVRRSFLGFRLLRTSP